jgi:hypothetical protein
MFAPLRDRRMEALKRAYSLEEEKHTQVNPSRHSPSAQQAARPVTDTAEVASYSPSNDTEAATRAVQANTATFKRMFANKGLPEFETKDNIPKKYLKDYRTFFDDWKDHLIKEARNDRNALAAANATPLTMGMRMKELARANNLQVETPGPRGSTYTPLYEIINQAEVDMKNQNKDSYSNKIKRKYYQTLINELLYSLVRG